MKIPHFRSGQFQRAVGRAGTAVWLMAGIALLAMALRTQWRPPTASAAVVTRALAAPVRAESAQSVYRPATSLESGDEVVLVFIGASFCNAHNRPGFPTVVENAKLRVQEQARKSGARFRVVGVALDWRASDGVAFLGRFGEFDEVASGGNWIGDGATKYIWRDIPGNADVPQMLVLRRSVQADQTIRVGEDRVVKRVLGAVAIEQWVASGAAL